jgi:elongation factor P
MKIVANSIRQGNVLVHRDDLWVVSKAPEHTKPGKGPAYIQLEMKNLKTGTKLNERFSSTDTVERASLEKKSFTYLYMEGEKLVLMDDETFDQIYVSQEIVGEKMPFMSDGMKVEVEFYEEQIISIELPSTVVLEVVETDPVIKGATATSSYKPAIMSNGIRVMVPPYLVTGEKIVVKTEDSSFVERSK